MKYVFAHCLATHGMRAHEILVMSNHHHIVLTDVHGVLPAFMEHLNSLVARAMNALLGIRGTVFEKDYSAVVVTTQEAAIEHSVYTLANPASSHLVKRCTQWPGFSTRTLNYGEAEVVERPTDGLWAKARPQKRRRKNKNARRAARGGKPSTMPAEVKLTVYPPFSDEDRDAKMRSEVLSRLHRRETELMVERSEKGIQVLGAARVCAQKWHTFPGSSEDWFATKPTVSGRCQWKRREAMQRQAEFVQEYRRVRRCFKSGERDIEWPLGTWMMARRHDVPVAQAPS